MPTFARMLAIAAVNLAALACSRAPGRAEAPRFLTKPTSTTRTAAATNPPGEAWGFTRTRGGLGGRILRVTTLAPRGPGSLSEALDTAGPRIVVFEVAGVIDLDRASLKINVPFLTIAGQTAPSPGITLIKGGLTVVTHDVVIEHLHVRPGEAGQAKGSGWEVDAISTGRGAHDVIIDHCSTTWATDENLSASGGRFLGSTADEWRAATSHRITFSNNLIAEGLSNSTHKKGEHSKGSLIHDNVTGVALIDNLFASNVERNPFFKGGARGVVVNNLVTNPGKYAMKYTLKDDEWETHPHQLGQMAIVGNVFRYGPSTTDSVPLLSSTGVGKCEIYLHDNLAKTTSGQDAAHTGGLLENFISLKTPPTWPDGLVPRPASEVAEYVRHNVGARPWDRDAIDTRIVEQALAGGGKIIDGEADVGGYPVVPEIRAKFNEEEWDLATLRRRARP